MSAEHAGSSGKSWSPFYTDLDVFHDGRVGDVQGGVSNQDLYAMINMLVSRVADQEVRIYALERELEIEREGKAAGRLSSEAAADEARAALVDGAVRRDVIE